MIMRENSIIVIAALALVGGLYYQGYTSEDVEQTRKKLKTEYTVAREYALDLKKKYVSIRQQCRSDSEWKSTAKCETVKDIDTKAQKVWIELKKLDETMKDANEKAKKVRDAMKTIEKIKSDAVIVAETISKING